MRVSSQNFTFETHFLPDKRNIPFWIASNNNGIYENGSILNLRFQGRRDSVFYNFNFALPQTLDINQILIYNSEINYVRKNMLFGIGKRGSSSNNDILSSGSLLESNNSSGIPRIFFGSFNYHQSEILDRIFYYKFSISHGWLDKSQYLQSPYFHEKTLNIKKKINGSNFTLGLKHFAIWGGETIHHGKQPSSFNDFFKVFFARPGSERSLKQEQENSLGNHFGVWDFSFKRKIKDKLFTLYYEHPFEDESGARWFLNEFDGKYGFNVTSFKSNFISEIIYEFIYTMDQSGPQGASDSTYGWDNYFNHYIYQSGWTYNNRMIGNPLFTVGKNPDRYNDGLYIINNRIKAHHFGLAGKIRHNANYRILFTYSKNYGIYPDQNYFQSINKDYKFEDGLEQLSTLYEIKLKNLWGNISITAAYANDRGDLLPKRDSFMMIINYKL